MARPLQRLQDEIAASLQPSVAPGTTAVQSPFEAQGRGFIHGHGEGHSIIGLTMHWLRKAVGGGWDNIATTVTHLRDTLLRTAASVQYESAREPGMQLGVHNLRTEPFTAREQRHSRMDGAEEEDGTLRELVQVAPPLSRAATHAEGAQSCCGAKQDTQGRRCCLQRCSTHWRVPVGFSVVSHQVQLWVSRLRFSAN